MSMAQILSKVKVVAACQCGSKKQFKANLICFIFQPEEQKSVALVFLERGEGSTDNMSRTNSLEGTPENRVQ